MGLVLFAILLGIIGTAVGGIITIIIGKRSEKMICYLLSFAGGVMAAVSFFELIPFSVEMSNTYVAVGGMAVGVLIVLLLNKIVDKITAKNKKLHETPEELYHQTGLIEQQQKNTHMFRSGIIMLLAITLHNFPEGLAIGSAISHEVQFGITIAIIMAVHNIPEGMAIAAPLYAGGMKRWKIIFWTTVAAIPTVASGILGYLLGNISELLQAVCLSVSGGAMLYVVFGEIMPQSISMTKSRMPTIITLLGIVIGLFITQF